MKSTIALILLSIYTVSEFFAYLPQIVKLIKTKSADDISLASWLVWIVSGLCYLIYVLMESPEPGIIFAATLNLFFVVFVFCLTIHYQKRKKR